MGVNILFGYIYESLKSMLSQKSRLRGIPGMPILDKSKLIQTLYELFENDESLAENSKENQETVQAYVQAFLSGLSYLRYDSESNTFSWYIGDGPEKQFVSAEDFVTIGRELISKESIDEAIAVLITATHLNPQSVNAHQVLAAAFKKQGDVVAYAEQIKLISELEPANEDTHYDLGMTYANEGLVDEAIAEFKQVNEGDFGADILTMLGWGYHLRGEDDKAIAELKLALEDDGGFTGAYESLAEIYRNMGLLKQAIQVYETVVNDWVEWKANLPSSVEPQEVYKWIPPFDQLGVLYLEAKLYDKAISMLVNAIEGNPNDAGSHYNLGMAYEAKLEMEKAHREFMAALKIDSSFELALESLERVFKSPPNGKIVKIKEPKGQSTRDLLTDKAFKTFENRLRTFISNILEASFGNNWWKQNVPQSIREASMSLKTKRESIPSLDIERLPPIHYTNIHELLEIIERQDNWKVFEPVFGNKLVLSSKMQELTTLRNDMAHSRKLSPRSQQKLKLYIEDLTHCMLIHKRQNRPGSTHPN
jgi:tetratricopeptide (TPR) repeat protein